MKFWPNPYYKRSDWKTWSAERFSEALTSKLWNKKIHAAEAYRNGAKLNYICFLWSYQISLADLTKEQPCEVHEKK